MFITETFLHSGISNGLLDPKHYYTIIRNDRSTDRGGGVLFCKPEYSCVSPEQYTHLEILCFDTVNLFPAVRYFLIYSDESAVQYMYTLIECLQLFTVDKHINVIVGDINIPKINWETLTCPTDSIHKPFLDCIVIHNLFSSH